MNTFVRGSHNPGKMANDPQVENHCFRVCKSTPGGTQIA